MPENLFNSAQKSNSEEFNENYDRIFKKNVDFDPAVFDCAEYGCHVCPNQVACAAYLNKKYDLSL